MKKYYSISYVENKEKHEYGCFSKKEMVYEYLKILSGDEFHDKKANKNHRFFNEISELKFLVDGKDYTETLNRFLYPKD